MGPKSRFLVQKSNFCHTTPILVNGPFVALGETVHFPHWERFFVASKSLPPPHCGAPSTSNSPSTLSAHPLRARTLHAGWINTKNIYAWVQVALGVSQNWPGTEVSTQSPRQWMFITSSSNTELLGSRTAKYIRFFIAILRK